jgi:hypothetical protein
MRTLKISLLVFILSISLFSQIPDTLWTKVFGSDTSEDWGKSFVESDDSGYVIVGNVQDVPVLPLWIFKTDKNGNLIWSKTYGANGQAQAWSIKKTLDGCYIVCGVIIVPPLNGNIWLLKFDTNGDTLWTKRYSGTGNVYGRSIIQTKDGDFILLGQTVTFLMDIGLIMIKTDSLGEMIWTKYFEHCSSSYGNNIVEEAIDKNYILLSTVESANLTDILLMKTNSLGDTIWTRTYGGIGWEAGNCVLATSDGGYIITGYANPPISEYGYDLWIFKTDSIGEVIWSKTFGTDTTQEIGSYVIETSNREFLLVGNRQTKYGASLDIWILKINSLGDTLWTKTIGGTYTELAYSLLETNTNDYLVLGWTDSFWLSNVWLIKLTGEPVNVEVAREIVLNDFKLSQNYPNPFNPVTKIKYEIPASLNPSKGGTLVQLVVYDILGREVAVIVNEEKQSGDYEIEFDGGNLPSGVYLYKLTAGNFSESKKLILLK